MMKALDLYQNIAYICMLLGNINIASKNSHIDMILEEASPKLSRCCPDLVTRLSRPYSLHHHIFIPCSLDAHSMLTRCNYIVDTTYVYRPVYFDSTTLFLMVIVPEDRFLTELPDVPPLISPKLILSSVKNP